MSVEAGELSASQPTMVSADQRRFSKTFARRVLKRSLGDHTDHREVPGTHPSPFVKFCSHGQAWWHMPLILVLQNAEGRRLLVPDHPSVYRSFRASLGYVASLFEGSLDNIERHCHCKIRRDKEKQRFPFPRMPPPFLH